MLTVVKLEVKTFSTDFLDILWEISPVGVSDSISNYLFYLYRSGAETGPWDLISTGMQDKYHFRDRRVSLISKQQNYWYRLKVSDITTGEESYYGPSRLTFPADVIALELARKNALALKINTGERCYIFKRKSFGARCTNCYDPKLEHKTKSDCKTCFNTSFQGGYFRPIVTWVNITEQGDNLVQGQTGDITRNQATGELSNYPVISPRDVLVDALNRRWRIMSPVQTQKLRGYLVRQTFGLSQIEPSDIEYKLPIKQSNYQEWPAPTNSYLKMTDLKDTAQMEVNELTDEQLALETRADRVQNWTGSTVPESNQDDGEELDI